MRVAVLTLALWCSAVPAVEEALPPLPPRGRPLHFDEERSPIGSFQTPTVHAEPTELQAEDPLTYTVRVTASGKVFRPPVRADLHKIPDFSEQFEIDNVGEGEGRLDAKTWEFVYRLRPRSAEVKAIPGFPYAFFTPGFLPPHQGYQTRFVPPVELTVKPRAEVKPDTVQGSQPLPRGPDALYRVESDRSLLRRQSVEQLPPPLVVAVLLLVPPACCIVWVLLWHRRHPTAAHLARHRSSRAARIALKALRGVSPHGFRARTERAADIVTDYLCHRFELTGRQPTPDEVSAHLLHVGVPPDPAGQAAAFFRACDVARFSQRPTWGGRDPAAAAARVIATLEAVTGGAEPGRGRTAGFTAVLGFLILAGSAAAFTFPPEIMLEAADLAFQGGVRKQEHSPSRAKELFREAATTYEQLREEGSRNSSLYQCEGNAWLLSGDTARAILAYRRGLQLDPGDRALRECLAFAREQVVYPSPGDFARPPVEQRPPWLPRLSPSFQFVLAGAVYIIGWLALTRWWMTRKHGLLAISGVAFVVFLLLGASLVWQDWQRQVEARYPLVAIKDDGVLLYRGNGLAYPRYETPLNAGVEARLLFERGDWLQIELAGGEVGWVPRQYALTDTP